MMKKNTWNLSVIKELKHFLILWGTQTLSGLGTGMTGFALILWSYQQQGSALTTALLSVCSYAPYVIMSIFAGAVSDRWRKKTVMLSCDGLAALGTLAVVWLLHTGQLRIWHLYLINGLNGLMNTFQRPASEVASTLLTPEKHYQRIGSLHAFSSSLQSILTPVLASAVFAFGGLMGVLFIDLATFLAAFFTLAFLIPLKEKDQEKKRQEAFSHAVRSGLAFLRKQRGILDIILFLAAINFTASMFNAALPALVIPKAGETALGLVQGTAGIAMLAGSLIATLLPAPKSRVKVICNALLLSMSTENFFLALGGSVPVWCIGAVLGWIAIPLMNTNLDALLRSSIPMELQGRVYACRNSLQFFTIPLGYLAGGALVDRVFEPWMAAQKEGVLTVLFGSGKGSGAAALYLLLGFLGVITCVIFRRDRHIRSLENPSFPD